MTQKVNLAELSLEKAERLVAEVQQHVNAAQQETREAHDAFLKAKNGFSELAKEVNAAESNDEAAQQEVRTAYRAKLEARNRFEELVSKTNKVMDSLSDLEKELTALRKDEDSS